MTFTEASQLQAQGAVQTITLAEEKHVFRHQRERDEQILSRVADWDSQFTYLFEHLQVLQLRTWCTLHSHSSRCPTSFFCSSSPNDSLLMHSIHFLLILELEVHTCLGYPNDHLGNGMYKLLLHLAETQNSGPSSQPISHPSVMHCGISVVTQPR